MGFWAMGPVQRFRRAALIVAIGALCAACAAGGYSAGSTRRHLMQAGLSASQADCVVLHMGPRFGDDRLNQRVQPTPKELAAMRALLRTCGVKLPA
jgi:hypothetical protein